MRRPLLILVTVLMSLALLCALSGAYLAEGTIRRHPQTVTENVVGHERIVIQAQDQTPLVGYYAPTGSAAAKCILLLHGSGSSHRGMEGFVRMFHDAGYATLTPDSRGHGESGGDFVTYGLLEGRDLSKWIDWLSDGRCPSGIFTLGESMGGDAVLNSLQHERRIRAAVVESAFSNFGEVAAERINRRAGSSTLSRAIVGSGLAYVHLRYGFDLTAVPQFAATSTPILFIHGLRDNETLPDHSRRLHSIYPNSTLWEVPNAGHTGAFGSQPAEFRRRVVDWFDSSGQSPNVD